MRNVILLFGVLLMASCSGESFEEDLYQEQEIVEISYDDLIVGDWDDLSDDDEDASFDGEKVVFSSGDLDFEYEYWIDGDEITIKYADTLIKTRKLIIDGDKLIIGDREYLRI